MQTRFSLGILIATTACVAMVLAASHWVSPGVTITVRNEGSSPLFDLRVHVTGKSYQLGDIEGGSTRKCKVHPTSESHVEISYKLPDGTPKRHTVDCYFEPGYRGTLEAEIQGGELIHWSDQIRLSWEAESNSRLVPCLAVSTGRDFKFSNG